MTAIYDNYLALVDHLSPKEREELEAFVPDDPWRLTGCGWINTMLRKEFSLTEEKADAMISRYWLMWRMILRDMDAYDGKRKLAGSRQ